MPSREVLSRSLFEEVGDDLGVVTPLWERVFVEACCTSREQCVYRNITDDVPTCT